MENEKEVFLKTVVPEWIETAQQRESQWVQYDNVTKDHEVSAAY